MSLSSVEFENGSSLCSVGRFAFLDCNNLSSITLPAAVSIIGFGAFSGCTNLSNIAIEGSATSMMIETVSKDDLSYSGGSGTPYRYNDNVEEYGTFYGCLSLSTISLPSRLTDIGNYSFYGCTALKTIKFSENATLATIGDYGFYDCPMLHTVDMSNCNQVTKIGASAFQSSDEMRLFKIGTVVPPTCGSTPFGAVGNYSVLKVPDGAVTQYQSASGWKDFASITSLNE